MYEIDGVVTGTISGTQTISGTVDNAGGSMIVQAKSVDPIESQQMVTPDMGYDALSSVTVGAIPSDYIGSEIRRRAQGDILVDENRVFVPSGYYETSTATSILAVGHPNPTVSINGSTGLITATHTQATGYVTGGTTTDTAQLTTKSAETYHPSTTDQIIQNGNYLTGAQTIKAVTTSNLVASNIASGVTVTIGDEDDADRIASVTGTYDGGGSSVDLKGIIDGTTTEIVIPNDVTRIRDYAFYGLNNADISSIPSSVTNIGKYAFYGCGKLTADSIPNGVTTISEHTFESCAGLTTLNLSPNITQINPYAFSGCTNLVITSLPDTLVRIDSYAFRVCAKIINLSCNGRLIGLGTNAFAGNTSFPMRLKTVRFPYMVISSLGSVFGNPTQSSACQQLELADIGSTNGISQYAFSNCMMLSTLILRRSDAICALGYVNAFENTPFSFAQTGKVYVPSALISTYQTAANWSTLYNNGNITFVAIEGSEYEL